MGPYKAALNKRTRKLHRWGAVIVAAPLLIVICTGLLLQAKKQLNWVQPPLQRGAGRTPAISFDRLLEQAAAVTEAHIDGWEDIDRLDVRPADGIVKVHARNRWELQIDTATGAVLQAQYRRSDLIESLHDGSWFHSSAKLWVFLPSGVVLLAMWATGVYLWWLPVLNRRAARMRRIGAHRVDLETAPATCSADPRACTEASAPANGRALSHLPGVLQRNRAGEKRH